MKNKKNSLSYGFNPFRFILFIFLYSFICFQMIFPQFLSEKKRLTIDRVVAIVNDEVITMTDIQSSLFPLIKQLRGTYHGEELTQKVNEATETILEQLIANKLILQTAVNLKDQEELRIPEKDILSYVQRIVDRFPSEEVFKETLKRENLSMEDFKKDCTEQLLVKRLVAKKVSSRVFITNADIKKYYDDHHNEFVKEPNITFSQIWLKKDTDPESKMTKMKEIQEKIKNGEDFKTLTVQFSEGPHAKEGGVWKNVKKGQFTKEIDDVIWSLNPNEVSPIIETRVSLHIVKVDIIEKERTIPLEDVWDDIQNKIYFERAEKIRKEWIKKLKSEAYIEIIENQ